MPRALIVGRFQPVHNGHIRLIRAAIEDAVHVVIAIGSSEDHGTLRNPFTFDERRSMIQAVFPDVEVIGVPDIHDPPNYPAHSIRLTGPVDTVWGNDDSTLDLFEDAGYTVHRPGLHDREHLEGTTIRAWLAEEDPEWKRAVPKPIAELLIAIEASKRLRSMER